MQHGSICKVHGSFCASCKWAAHDWLGAWPIEEWCSCEGNVKGGRQEVINWNHLVKLLMLSLSLYCGQPQIWTKTVVYFYNLVGQCLVCSVYSKVGLFWKCAGNYWRGHCTMHSQLHWSHFAFGATRLLVQLQWQICVLEMVCWPHLQFTHMYEQLCHRTRDLEWWSLPQCAVCAVFLWFCLFLTNHHLFCRFCWHCW